ncbi:MAG: GntR family transcriptional regulator [Chitinophagaceae bacterium]|nr:GntR family transcriptional regulator [Chitinophagaceae bacterium]
MGLIKSNQLLENDRYKFQLLTDMFINAIETGALLPGSKMPSMKTISNINSVSLVTVSRAYMHLKGQNYIANLPGRGFYVIKRNDRQLKIVLIFNKLCYYKKMIYDGIVETLGQQAQIELHLHHYNSDTLTAILLERLNYDHFIIMPHFEYGSNIDEYVKVINSIDPKKLLFLDRRLPEMHKKYRGVYQDFKAEAFNALNSLSDLLIKYDHLKLLIPTTSHHPLDIIDGVQEYCTLNRKSLNVISKLKNEDLVQSTAFIVIEETDLADLIKKADKAGYQLGKDIGVISLNETILKELLNITTFSTDFKRMGQIAAQMILNGDFSEIENGSTVIRRNSL